MPLTPNQARIVEAPTDRCVLVNAGPGSGKTHVLVERYLHLITAGGFQIPEVLVVTFTRKAARELKERLARRLLESGRLETSLALETAWVTNFHGLCFRILRENALVAGFEPSSRVQDEVEAADVCMELRREFLQGPEAEEALLAEEAGDPIPAAVVDRVGRAFDQSVRVLGRGRENLLDARTIVDQTRARLTSLGEELELEESSLTEEIAAHEFFSRCLPEVEARYEGLKQKESLLDYVDLQTRAVEFLESDSAARVREQFKVILVDEFQDTNRVQLELLRLLARPAFANLMAVGDERQSIYAFRGARIENIRQLPALVASQGGACLVQDLYESFRAYQEILDVSTSALVAETEPGDGPQRPALVSAALGVAEEDDQAARPVVRVLRCDSKDDEAERIAEEILSRRGQPIVQVDAEGVRKAVPLQWGHFAILLRSVGSVRAYEEAMRARGIPYRTFGGSGFYDRREILDLLAYLQVVANPYDGLALIRVLQQPPFGLSDRSLHRLANLELHGSEGEDVETDAHEDTVVPGFRLKPFDALRRALDEPDLAREIGLEEETLHRLARLREFIEQSLQRRETVPVSRLLLDVLEETGYGKLLMADVSRGELEALRRRKNVERLLRLARRFEHAHVYGSLQELVRYLKRAVDEQIREEEEGLEADGRVVNVLTVHQAKGMEWPVVFVAGVNNRSWPMRAWPAEVVFFEGEGAVLRRSVLGYEDNGKQVFDETRLHQHLNAASKLAQEEEERRVLFVAMTRAKNLLFLSGSGKSNYLDRVAGCLPESSTPNEPDNCGEDSGQADVTASPMNVAEALASALERITTPFADEDLSGAAPQGVHLSFSHVSLYDTCPLKYKFTFVTPLPGMGYGGNLEQVAKDGKPADLAANELGTVLHEALERWAVEDRPLEQLVEVAARDRGWGELSESDQERAALFVENFQASRLSQRKPGPEDVEVPFTLALKAPSGLLVTVTGSIDRLDQEPDGSWTITDYKTNRSVKPERYRLQLSIYKLALERAFGRRVHEAYAYFVQHPEKKGLVQIDTLEAEATESKVLEVAQRIAARDFEVRSHPGKGTCWSCPFGGSQGFCPERVL
jgi:ATP-dependent helicase/nuclease subunit A